MRKIYSFIALMLLFCVTTADAQRRWSIAAESTTEIKPNQDYVIQEGFNTVGWSTNGFLNSGPNDVVAEVDESCIYRFVPVEGEMKEGLQVWTLKNLKEGKYLSDGELKYVASQVKAFKFTAVLAKEKPADTQDVDNWFVYHDWTQADRCAGAEAANAWVMCSPNQRLYICIGGNPTFWSYVDTNNWLIKEATEEEVSAYDKLTIIFNEYYKFGVEEDSPYYPIGTTPGCVSKELFDAMKAVYDEAVALTSQTADKVKPEDCDRVREAIIASFERYKNEVVKVTEGFYLLVNQRSQDAAWDGGNMMRCSAGVACPDSWPLPNAKYIWQVVPSAEKGKFYLKNWGTGNYLGKGPGTSQAFPMIADTTVKFTAEQYQGVLFNLIDQAGNVTHNDAGHKVVVWNDKGATGGQWRFDAVPPMVMDTLGAKVEQDKMNVKLRGLYNRVNADLGSKQYKNGFTANGEYHGAGLVNSFMKCNATETTEGSEAAAFDGNLGTYYHTLWHADQAPQDDYHWVQVDLGKEVNSIYVKFSQRHNNRNGNPSRIALVAPTDGMPDEPMWSDTLVQDTVVYQYATAFPNGTMDSTTFVGKYEFNKPVQYLRFVVKRTKANQIFGFGPCWHVSELRFYDAAETVPNPVLAQVPAAVMETLNNALAAAKAELDNKAATQDTYDVLEAALKAFEEAYPDAADLKKALEVAAEMESKVVEGAELGLFQAGAKEELKAVITEIQTLLDETEAADKALSLADLQANEKKLDNALKAFYAKMNVPEAGKVYRIKSTAGYVLDAEGNQQSNEDGTPQERDQNDSYIASLNADYEKGTPVWRYNANDGDIDTRFNTLWVLEKDEKGYAFKNLANGLYMGNPYEGLTEEELKDASIPANMGYSKTPKHFGLEAFTADFYEAGSFLLNVYKSEFVNLQPTGNVVHWGDRNDPHAAFTFEEVIDFNDYYTVNVQAGKVQIVSLPIDLSNVYNIASEVAAYEVVGLNGNKLMLELIADGAGIKAGTPFVIQTKAADPNVEGDQGENTISVILTSANEEDLRNLKYNYEPVVAKGMVSAPLAFELEAGYGFLLNNKVVTSEGGESVAAGSGFFNKDIPETTAEGSMVLEVDGQIIGQGTAVENAVIVKNVANDVYSISGVKVRSNVKAGAATKNLPKGVYVVGGKKVVVK